MDITKSLNKFIKNEAVNGTINTKKISDGENTFGELYEQKAKLFMAVCNVYPNISWKFKDNEIDDCFLAGIYTPNGQATYHLKNSYWDKLNISETDGRPFCDMYSEKEMVERITSLSDLVNYVEKEKGNGTNKR